MRPPRPIGPVAVLLLAVMVRLALVWPRLAAAPEDPDNYLPMARSVVAGEGLVFNGRPTAYRPPLYPLVLAPIAGMLGSRAGPGVLLLNVVLGAATAGATMHAARRWGYSTRRLLVAGLIVACDPVLAAQSRAVMTETLAACLIAAALAALAGSHSVRSAAIGGLMLGLATLCRPSLLACAGSTALAALLFGPGGVRQRGIRSAVLAAVVALTLAPWAIRNAIALGEPVWTTTHGGYTLALANNDAYYGDVLHGPRGAVWSGPNQRAWWDRVNRITAGLSEPQADRLLRREAIRTAQARPGDFGRAALGRLGRFWGIAPAGAVYSRGLRLATACWTVPLWIALALGLARRDLWRWPCAAAPAVVLALTAVHALYWTDLRMRAPIVPAVALIAAGAAGVRSRITEESC